MAGCVTSRKSDAQDGRTAGRPPEMSDGRGGESARAYTVRLELVDEPGELLNALEPIAKNGGNLLSIHHERGSVTPRGRIPVEVDLEVVPDRFEDVVGGLQDAGVTVIEAGEERFSEALTIILVGHLVESGLSDTLERIEACPMATILDVALSAPRDTGDVSSARVRLAVDREQAEATLEAVRELASEKDLRVIEPQIEEAG